MIQSYGIPHLYAQSLEFGPPLIVQNDLSIPCGVAVDTSSEKIFIANTGFQKITFTIIEGIEDSPIWSEFGYVEDRSLPEALNGPQGIAADQTGHIYLADTYNNEAKLYRWNANENTYQYDPNFTAATRNEVDNLNINLPRDIAVGPDGKIFLLDSGNDRILVAEGPNDTTWEVWRSDADWGNPYGIDVSADGNIFIADTDNHRVLCLKADGTEQAYGSYGTGSAQFRFPRDVAIGPEGRIFVADTYNHRVHILKPDGTYYRILGSAPLFGKLEKIEVDQQNRVFVIDSEKNRIVAYLGPDTEPQFDAYIRDYAGDDGTQPSKDGYSLSSPDILIRHQPDVDLEYAKENGLTAYAFQQPKYGENNYVYISVRNRGKQEINGIVAKFYWADPDGRLEFPAFWNPTGFFNEDSHEVPNNFIFIPSIPSRKSEENGPEEDGSVVAGPLIWAPPQPETSITGKGRFYLSIRLVHFNDPTEVVPDMEFADQVRLNNNIAIRKVSVSAGPYPIGPQNTLVVQANFPDIDYEADPNVLSSNIQKTDEWMREVSYDLAPLVPHYKETVNLAYSKEYYFAPEKSPLVEFTTDVLDHLISEDPFLFEGTTDDPEDDIHHLVIQHNDPDNQEIYSTSGSWIYDFGKLWTLQEGGAFRAGTFVRTYADATGIYAIGHSEHPLPGKTKSSFGDQDFFIIKYDFNGKSLWSEQFGTDKEDEAIGVYGDETGIYFVGDSGDKNIWLRKFSFEGITQWTELIVAGGGPVFASDVYADASGVYVAGSVSGNLGPGGSVGHTDAFIRKFNAAGEKLWTRQFGTDNWDEANAVYADASGIYVTGFFHETNYLSWDSYVRKYDHEGNLVWEDIFGLANQEDMGLSITGNTSGIFVTGFIMEEDPEYPFENTVLLRKYTGDGDFLWKDEFTSTPIQVRANEQGAFLLSHFEGVSIRHYGNSGSMLWENQISLMHWSWLRNTSLAINELGLFLSWDAPLENTIQGFGLMQHLDLNGHEVSELTLGISGIRDVLYGMYIEPYSDARYIYTCGYTGGTLSEDPNSGDDDAFVSCYDFEGNRVWSKLYGNELDDYFYDLNTDGWDLYVVGSRHPYLGEDQYDRMDAVIEKISVAEDMEWTANFGTPEEDRAQKIAFEPQTRYFYVGGITKGNFEGFENQGGYDVFITKFDIEKNQFWSYQFGTSTHESIEGIAADDSGVYAAGNNGAGTTNFLGAYLCKIDKDGLLDWEQHFTEEEKVYFFDLFLYESFLYVVGVVPDKQQQRGDALLRKYDLEGALIWERKFGTGEGSAALDVFVNEDGIYVLGNTNGAFPGYQNQGEVDVFIRKYDLSGNYFWTRQLGSENRDEANSIFVHSSGLYVGGKTQGELTGLVNLEGFDIFLRKYELEEKRGIKKLSVSVLGPNSTSQDYDFGISHQLGLKDLSIHENVDFPLPFTADQWDNMAEPHNGVHPLTWSKELATWVTSSGGRIFYIPRPPKGAPPRIGEPSIELNYQSILEVSQYGAIAIGLTEGVTTFEEESHFYWVEARSPNLGNADAVVPAEGVIAYYANKLIPEGQGPVVVQDYSPNTSTIEDAVIPVSATLSPQGSGIIITVESELPDQKGYAVKVDYDPPDEDYNLYLAMDESEDSSPDIWVDNQQEGGGYLAYDQATGKSAGPSSESLILGEQNRLFARVHNTGPGTAYNIEVQFLLTPTGSGQIGGPGNYELYKSVFIDDVPPGDYRDVFATWLPSTDDSDRVNLRVELRRLVDDNNDADNTAWEHFNVIESTQASPFQEVVIPFSVINTEAVPRLYYFRAEGIPLKWKKSLLPDKQYLQPGEEINGQLKIQPPGDAASCTNHDVRIAVWSPQGRTLIKIGEVKTTLKLRNQISLSAIVDTRSCTFSPSLLTKGATGGDAVPEAIIDPEVAPTRCAELIVTGQTNPSLSKEKIIIRYSDPIGNPTYHEINTDEEGHFEDRYYIVDGGPWTVTATYPGNSCSGEAEWTRAINIPLFQSGDHDGDGLPDDKEIQGDADLDKIPNHLDKDSDQDGFLDGKEPYEDYDLDGFYNMIDLDSDNDGKPDKSDFAPFGPIQYPKWEYYLSGGRFIFDNTLPVQDNTAYGVRLEHNFRHWLGLESEVNYTLTTDQDDIEGRVLNANLNALFNLYFNYDPKVIPFLAAGAGKIFYQNFSKEDNGFILNIGLGLKAPNMLIRQRLGIRWDVRFFYGEKVFNAGWNKNWQVTGGVIYYY